MVFDYILDDKSVPETVKGEISRLQIVAVKAAILDRTFFARRQHPMRQLLDRVAEVAADPDIATEEGARFILELRAMVDYIVHKFTDDLAIFIAALDTLEQMVAENRGRGSRSSRRPRPSSNARKRPRSRTRPRSPRSSGA